MTLDTNLNCWAANKLPRFPPSTGVISGWTKCFVMNWCWKTSLCNCRSGTPNLSNSAWFFAIVGTHLPPWNAMNDDHRASISEKHLANIWIYMNTMHIARQSEKRNSLEATFKGPFSAVPWKKLLRGPLSVVDDNQEVVGALSVVGATKMLKNS